MKCKIFFNGGDTSINEVSEQVLVEQMKRPQNKRLYVCGIEFSEVERVEVLKWNQWNNKLLKPYVNT